MIKFFKEQEMINITTSNVITEYETCVALGNFDGVHIGHRKILNAVIEYSVANNLKSCVYTFSTHPCESLGINKTILTDNTEKFNLLEDIGIEIMYAEDFTKVRNISPRDFCYNILKEKLNAKCVFCGENYSFGYQGAGNTEILQKLLDEIGIKLFIVPYAYTENGTIVSSTIIRNLITNGNVAEASVLMDSYYTVSGKVLHGKKLGRKIGFPTLNIAIPQNKTIPMHGVYISACLLDGKMYKGITNIGIRPTTDTGTKFESIVNCETYLYDYNNEAYDKKISVFFFDMIRKEMKFESIDALKTRISEDKSIADKFFGSTLSPFSTEKLNKFI